MQKIKLTYYGHACFSVAVGGKTLLFDPFITQNELAKSIDVNTIPADYILISHGHFDHVSDAVAIAQRTGAKIISTPEVVGWCSKNGVTKLHMMNTGGRFHFDFGAVKMVNAVHSSSMPDGSYGGNPIGFVIEHADGAFYYSGDTALNMDMKLIPLICKKLDLAILPIGDNFTMGLDDAILASDFVDCANVLGVHFDTFGHIKIDHAAAQKQFADKGKTLSLLSIGETKEF
jgi:L-ascorbate metabolism protein UlaG (beta-lactamase superfamily)